MNSSQELLQCPKWVFLLALILLVPSYMKKDALPDASEIDARLLQSPVQTPTRLAPFMRTFQGKNYMISPKFEYELYGLVVSSRNLEKTWYNIDYKRDPYNIKDLCVIWGGNLISNDFRKIHYESGLWTCYVRYGSGVVFIPDALSNNHLLPGNDTVLQSLEDAEPGDQIHFSGQLVDYTRGDGGTRTTSTTRSDTGNGACEVVYLDQFEILKRRNVIWKIGFALAKYTLIASGLAWLVVTLFIAPPRWK